MCPFVVVFQGARHRLRSSIKNHPSPAEFGSHGTPVQPLPVDPSETTIIVVRNQGFGTGLWF